MSRRRERMQIDRGREVARVTYETDDGDEVVVELPCRFEVCEGCRGKGTHVNRAIDGNGLTAADFDEDPDFRESYFRGDYDVVCDTCHGDRVEAVIDEDACKSPRQRAALEWLEASDRADAEDRYWQRLESAGER